MVDEARTTMKEQRRWVFPEARGNTAVPISETENIDKHMRTSAQIGLNKDK